MTRKRAIGLRHAQTDSERKLWMALRNRQLDGWKFRRQELMDPYIVDFVCHEAKLIVEVDGGEHQAQEAYDQRRTKYLNARGYTVIRFWNNEVLTNLDGVLEQVSLSLSPCGRGMRNLKPNGSEGLGEAG